MDITTRANDDSQLPDSGFNLVRFEAETRHILYAWREMTEKQQKKLAIFLLRMTVNDEQATNVAHEFLLGKLSGNDLLDCE